MIAGSWQSRPRFEGTCQLCSRSQTHCGAAYLLLVGEDSTLRFCCDNFTRISGWTLDEIRGLSVIKTTVEDKQFEILLLIRRLLNDPAISPTDAEIIGRSKDETVQPLKVRGWLKYIGSQRYIVVTGYPAPTKYLFESGETFANALRAWHQYLFRSAPDLSRYIPSSYRIRVKDPDVVMFAEPGKNIFRIGDDATPADLEQTIEGHVWLQAWRGNLSSSEIIGHEVSEPHQSLPFLTSIFSPFLGAHIDHVLQDAGISTTALNLMPQLSDTATDWQTVE